MIEYERILRRAFAGGNEVVHVDGWTTDIGRRAMAWAEGKGYVSSFTSSESQYTTVSYRITHEGRAALDVRVAEGSGTHE